MAKKKTNWLAYVPITSVGIAMLGGFINFQVQAQQTKTKVEELKVEVKEVAKETKEDTKEIKEKNKEEIEEVKKNNQEIEKGLTEMRVQQMYIQKSVDSLNENLKELLIEIKEDKKKK